MALTTATDSPPKCHGGRKWREAELFRTVPITVIGDAAAELAA